MKDTYFFDDAPNYQVLNEVKEPLNKYFAEVRQFLPELPEQINIWLDNDGLIKETGSGGFAYASDTINIAFDPNFPDKKAQLVDLKGSVYHEAYHLVQGHTASEPKAVYTTMLDSAVYEGCATVFEREYANTMPLWGDYSQHSDEELAGWRDAMKGYSNEEYWDEDSGLWPKWAFYDKEDGQRWKVYKVGCWIVDKAIKESGVGVLEMRTKSAEKIALLSVK